MASSIFFPIVVKKAGDNDVPGVLCSLALHPGAERGLFSPPLSDNNSDFLEPLLQVAKDLPLVVDSTGIDLSQLGLEGYSGSGCAHFIRQYDISALPDGLRLAISVYAQLAKDKAEAIVITACGVSKIPEKINVCDVQKVHILVLPECNRTEIEKYTEGACLIEHLDNQEKCREALKEANGTLVIFLASNNWDQKLANLFELPMREVVENVVDIPAPEQVESGSFLSELYLEALNANGEDGQFLQRIFKEAAPILDARMEKDTFPWKIMKDQDESGVPLKELIFKHQCHILTGPTSTGKTTVAKALLLRALLEKKQAVYVAPTRALVYEVYDDFITLLNALRKAAESLDNDKNGPYMEALRENMLLPEEGDIVLSTGEMNQEDGMVIRGSYRILFSVYEKANLFMNMLASASEGRHPTLIIIDELHMLCHAERGGILDLFLAKSLSLTDERKSCQLSIVGITTEKNGAQMLKRFFKSKPVGMETNIIEVHRRPVPTSHYLINDCSKPVLIERIQDAAVPISRQNRNKISRLLSEARGNCKGGFDPATLLKSKEPGSDRQHKKVIAVVNSIAGIYKLVEQLAPDINSQSDTESTTFKELQAALDKSFITERERKILEKGIAAGIFVYFSPLDAKLREQMAKAFKMEATGKPQLLLTTDALAYGVNLPADAIYLLNIREIDTTGIYGQGDYIKRNLYFNILGRAGRLGKISGDSCAAFIVLKGSGIALDQDVEHVLDFYNEPTPDSFHASAFDTADVAKILDNGTAETLDDISFVTFRTCVDSLRFENFVSKKDRANVKRTSVKAVRNRLEYALAGFQERPEYGKAGDTESREAAWPRIEDLLTGVFSLAQHADGFEETPLLEYINGGWVATDLASALIDTGTSWNAIKPIGEWIERMAKLPDAPPVELLLAGLLPVDDLWESIRSFDKLASANELDEPTEESNERAKNLLKTELDKICPGVEPPELDALMDAIESYVKESCSGIQLSPKHRVAPKLGAILNSFSRLLGAILAWADGQDANEIQKFASPKPNDQEVAVSFSSRYGERLCWLCQLALRFFSHPSLKNSPRRLLPAHERALQTLALRLRHGVPADCIPLIGFGKNAFSRAEVLSYRRKMGISPDILLRRDWSSYQGNSPHPSIGENEYRRLRHNVIRYYADNAANLCAILARGNINDETKKAFQDLKDAYSHLPKIIDGKLEEQQEWIESIKRILEALPQSAAFNTTLSKDGEFIIERKKDSRKLVFALMNPFYSKEKWLDYLQDKEKEEQCNPDMRKNLRAIKDLLRDNGSGIKRAKLERELTANKSGTHKDFLENALLAFSENKDIHERLKYYERLEEASNHILVYLPWNSIANASNPKLPGLSLAAAVLVLRQLHETGLDPVIKWQEAHRCSSHFPIKSLISEDKDAIDGLRSSLTGDLREAVLKMDDAVFQSSSCG